MVTINVYDKGQVDDIADAVLPDTSGASEGQVLGLDANLKPAWIDAGGGSGQTINLRNGITGIITNTYSTMSGVTTSVFTQQYSATANYLPIGHLADGTKLLYQPHYIRYYRYSSAQSIPYIYMGNATHRSAMNTYLNSISELKSLPDGNYFITLTDQISFMTTASGNASIFPDLSIIISSGNVSIDSSDPNLATYIQNPGSNKTRYILNIRERGSS